MTFLAAEASMSVPVSWVLASGATLAGAISALAGIIYTTMNARINDLRDTLQRRGVTMTAQQKTITALQSDISDLKKGCGAQGCLWKNR